MYNCFVISGFYWLFKNSTALHSCLQSASVYFEQCWQCIQLRDYIHHHDSEHSFSPQCSIMAHLSPPSPRRRSGRSVAARKVPYCAHLLTTTHPAFAFIPFHIQWTSLLSAYRLCFGTQLGGHDRQNFAHSRTSHLSQSHQVRALPLHLDLEDLRWADTAFSLGGPGHSSTPCPSSLFSSRDNARDKNINSE